MVVREQSKAVLQLLGDDDPETVALVKEQLSARGGGDLPELRELLATTDSAAAAQQIREIIQVIEERESERQFARLCANFPEHGDLESAAWSLAATLLPGEDFAPQRAMLDAWGREALVRLTRVGLRKEERLDVLIRFLARDLRLRGNEQEYYLCANSLLPKVIQTRVGIPISLVLVYMLVGQRAGLAIEGLGFPGHFFARFGEVIFDPFHGGRRVSLAECAAAGQVQEVTLLAKPRAATSREMLLRMLTNLRYIATNTDAVLAGKLLHWETNLRLSQVDRLLGEG